MKNQLIQQVKQEQVNKAELIEKENIRKMLLIIESKGESIKKLQGEKAGLEKMLDERDYSVLSQGWSYTMPNYMKLPSSLEDVLKFRRG